MDGIGKQYKNDDQIDKSGFLKKARKHQSEYRANTLNLPFEDYGNCLTEVDAKKGRNFYRGFGVYDSVQERYKKYSGGLLANMLRSEHIPFNIFIPFKSDNDYCAKVLNEFLGQTIKTVDRIEIEYAPPGKEKYLNDKTSFDTYIEYSHVDGTSGVLGIEVKYTEQGYKLNPKSSEAKGLFDGTSKYFAISDTCKLYKPGSHHTLIKDEYRQIWRNHLLGASMLHVDSEKFNHFTSITLFPEGNTHFLHHSQEYIKMLIKNKNCFVPITYEAFFNSCKKHCPNGSFEAWIDYLTDRYIVKEE